MSESVLVKEFTEGYGQIECPNHPIPLNREETKFLINMVISEIIELAQTVTDNDDAAKLMLINAVTDDTYLSKYKRTNDPDQLVADQADAAIDTWYYMLNAFCKKGINLSKIFSVVHEANMNKRDPKTGKFIKDAKGKTIKPEGWKEPDILGEIIKQKTDGSWS